MMSCLTILIGACATQGEPIAIKVNMPQGEHATIIAHPQSVPDWLLDPSTLKFNYIVKGDVSDEQLAAVAEGERACRIYTSEVRPNRLVSVIADGVVYGAVGYVGGGVGSLAFAGAVFEQYAENMAAVGGISGGIGNGIVTLGGATYTFENCGKQLMEIFPKYGIHIMQKSPY
ncbi:MAG TPA: hypothetical protein VM103_01660 [Candidatus Paceibacterota bacterium]|nr:hypothetical protein [Candidatus Paceibacterota bacterium]